MKTIGTNMRGRQFKETNYMFNWLGAENLCDLYKEGELRGELKELAPKLKEDDNFVIAIYKLKK